LDLLTSVMSRNQKAEEINNNQTPVDRKISPIFRELIAIIIYTLAVFTLAMFGPTEGFINWIARGNSDACTAGICGLLIDEVVIVLMLLPVALVVFYLRRWRELSQEVIERKEAEEALKESERHLRTIVGNVPVVLFALDREGVFTLSEGKGLEGLGLRPGEVVGRSVFEVYGAVPEIIENIRRTLGGEAVVATVEVGELAFETFYNPLLNEGGEIVGLIGVAGDITERKRAEEALRESEERFRSTFDEAAIGMTMNGLDGRFLQVNRSLCEMFGYSEEELLATTFLDITHPDDLEADLDHMRRMVEEEIDTFRTEKRCLHADGHVVWVSLNASVVRDAEGHPLYFIGQLQDITDHKQAEEKLHAFASRLSALIENLQAGILVEEDSRRITHLNQEFCTMFGIPAPPQALIGADCSNFAEESKGLFAEPEVFVRRIEQTLEERLIVRGEELLLADGRTIERDYIPIFVGEGYRGHLWQFRDITERKEAEEEKARQARHAALRADVSAALAKGGTLPSILQRCTECMVRHLDAAFVRIWTLDKEEKMLDLRASAGMYTHLDGPHSRVPLGEYKIGLIAQEREPHLTNDAMNDPRISDKEWAKREGMVAFAGHPLVVEGRVVGVMAMFAREPLREDTLEALGSVADTIAQGIKRKRTEEALWRSESSLATAQRIAHLGNWDYDIAKDAAQWSDELYRIFSFAPQQFAPTYKTFLNSVHPDDRDLIRRSVRKALYEEKQGSVDYRVVRADGEIRVVQSYYEVIRDVSNRAVKLVGTVHDITESKALEEKLHHQAFHDLLTGLPNRQLFMDRLIQALRRTRRREGRKKVAVLFLDLNNFKVVNDSLGHEIGDDLLKAVGERLRGSLRPEDTLARLGGDEFTVLVENVENPADAVRVAERSLEAFREPFVVEEQELFIKPSIGISLGEARTTTAPEDLLRDADTAMYRAKKEGLGYRVFEPVMYEQALRRLKMENELQRAIEAEEFVVHYQPIIDLRSEEEEVWGMEALVRWEHPKRGLLDPKEFVPDAEESGLVVPMGEWVLKEACEQAREWQERNPHVPPWVISVNLSARQLGRSDLARSVEGVLRETGLEASSLSLDITETLYIKALEGNTAALDALKSLGVRLSVDDFGTGYSSLSYLKRLPADALKIDRSFIRALGEDVEDTVIVQMIVDLAHTFGLEVIAEGVESEYQAAQLKEMGCDFGQGYHFTKPLPPKAVEEFLAR
jgi:diguanylate cyclase (GGDEF)-like protein/PAS domain S-box-containing protein